MTLLSIDIETSCAVVDCPGFGGHKKCDHALHHLRNKIDCIGVVYETEDGVEHSHVFRSVSNYKNFVDTIPNPRFLAHNGKFDYKNLVGRGFPIPDHEKTEDTYLMLVAYTYKIPPDWLEAYEVERKRLNKLLGKAQHREAGQYSLKSAAPYFAKVPAFWEALEMDNDDYVLSDCRNTLKLYKELRGRLEEDGTLSFYKEKLLPWARHLTDVELRGVTIDVPLMRELRQEAEAKLVRIKEELNRLWEPAYRQYNRLKREELYKTYIEKYGKDEKTWKRGYKSLRGKIKKIPKTMNLASPTQVYWIFKEYFKADIRDDQGKETTGAVVLEKLIKEGYLDLQLFRDMKETEKSITSFFDSYEEKLVDGKLYTSYNLGGTKTGRLSCNSPNLQQVSGDLHKIFIAEPGYLLATYDMAAIEPRLIAHYSGDARLSAIMQDTEKDFHSEVTATMFEHVTGPTSLIKKNFKRERDCAKQLGLSIMYGSGVNRAKMTFINHGYKVSDADVHHKLRAFKNKFSGTFAFKKDLDYVLETGGQIESVSGRRFRYEDSTLVYMAGMNGLVQSSGSDLVVDNGRRIDLRLKEIDSKAGVLLTVHDEVVVQIPEARLEECKSLIITEMTSHKLESAHGIIPLLVEGKISKRWEK